MLVQHLVMLEAVHERGGRALRRAGEKDRRARHAERRLLFQHAHEVGERDLLPPCFLEQQAAAVAPRVHHDYHQATQSQWHPSTFDDLQKIGAEEAEVDEEERHHQGRCRGQRPAPYLPDHHKCHYPGDNHRSRHGNAIGRRKRTRGSEHGHEQKHADQQNEVHARHIDLSVLRFRSVSDFEAREEAELNPLLADGIGAADDGLTRDHSRGRRQRDHR